MTSTAARRRVGAAPPSAVLGTAVESAPGPAAPSQPGTAFTVHLAAFEGPFDLLLSLISKHQLDLTQVALSAVTDEFLAYVRQPHLARDLGAVTEFLVVAATLLDLKIARLLPGNPVEDEEDLALLEARDLLFARLLQYRAYRGAAVLLRAALEQGARHRPRTVGWEEAVAGHLPPPTLGMDLVAFAVLAARLLAPRVTPEVAVDHVHEVRVSVPEQMTMLLDQLREHPQLSFRRLSAGAASVLEVIARFLALLELYRDGRVAFEQVTPLGDLHVHLRPDGAGLAPAPSAEAALSADPIPAIPTVLTPASARASGGR